MEASRYCRVCDRLLDDRNWYPSLKGCGNYICKSCHGKDQREYDQAHKPQRALSQRRRRKSNPEYAERQRVSNRKWMLANSEYLKKYRSERREHTKGRSLQRNYGMSLGDYKRLFIEQQGRCKICGIHQSELKNRRVLHVDHCHKTGKIRGLLCGRCNTWLGRYEDNGFVAQVREYLS